MLTFKLINYENGFYHYEIYPEGKIENKGWIVFNPDTKEVKEKVKPKGSIDYMLQFINNMKDKNGNYKKSGMVAWY